jgi:hypothetical protein
MDDIRNDIRTYLLNIEHLVSSLRETVLSEKRIEESQKIFQVLKETYGRLNNKWEPFIDIMKAEAQKAEAAKATKIQQESAYFGRVDMFLESMRDSISAMASFVKKLAEKYKLTSDWVAGNDKEKGYVWIDLPEGFISIKTNPDTQHEYYEFNKDFRDELAHLVGREGYDYEVTPDMKKIIIK